MIPKESELRVAAAVREDILAAAGAIRDSSGAVFAFRDPSPNRLTASRLRGVLRDFEAGLESVGARRIRAHAECGDAAHESLALWDPVLRDRETGYWRYEIADGRTDRDLVQGGELVIDGVTMEGRADDILASQVAATSPCPCTPDAPRGGHTISDHFVWPRDPESRIGDIAAVGLVLRDAIERSGDGKRRSGVRELLLQAVLHLEQLIVEETAGAVLARRIGTS